MSSVEKKSKKVTVYIPHKIAKLIEQETKKHEVNDQAIIMRIIADKYKIDIY